jgi:hypothetical protein
MNIAVKTVKPEKAWRERRSYRFSRNSGIVDTFVCR